MKIYKHKSGGSKANLLICITMIYQRAVSRYLKLRVLNFCEWKMGVQFWKLVLANMNLLLTRILIE
jgi:hypothetical protein